MIGINGKTKLIALIGSPIEHSQSPMIQNFGFDELKLNYRYLCFDIGKNSQSQDLSVQAGDAVKAMKTLGIRGYNVTMPYKEYVIKYLDEIDEYARASNSVNTIVNENGFLKGYNTDGLGFIMAVEKQGFPIKKSSIAIFGAGGTARSIATASVMNDCESMVLISRKGGSLEKTKEFFHKLNLKNKNKIKFLELENQKEIDKAISNTDIIVNATPIGLEQGDNRCILANKDVINSKHLVFELNYANSETALMKIAKKKSATVIGGKEQLLYQAVIAFKHFTGFQYPIDEYEKDFFKWNNIGNIYLIGFMGVGKTTISQELGIQQNMRVVDVDKIIEKSEGKKIPEIFEIYGEGYFRRKETEALKRLSKQSNLVVSCGGGAATIDENIEIMRKSGVVLELTCSLDELYNRLKRSSNKRPLLMDEKKKISKEKIRKLYGERKEIYKRAANISINTAKKSIHSVVREIVKAIMNNIEK